MPRIPGPTEYYKVTALVDGKYKRERIYKGPGGKKKAFDFATYAKRDGATNVVVEECLPEWNIIYKFTGQQ